MIVALDQEILFNKDDLLLQIVVDTEFPRLNIE